MQLLKFLFAAVLTLSLAFICNLHNPFGTSIPALGSLFSPFSGFWQNAESTPFDGLNPSDIDQLKAPVDVVFDDRLVPHIFAQHTEDAYFVQGYITAHYRLWQMDIATRAVSGQLSEIMGEGLLKRDQWQRRKGILFAAENYMEVVRQNPKELALMEAYADGVNAYVNQLSPADYPVEFKLLGYQPERWTPIKTALFLKYMAETLCARSDDVEASNMLALFGEEVFNDLYPLYNPNNDPIIPPGTDWGFEPLPFDNGEAPDSTQLSSTYPFETFPEPYEFIGSNNWAVSGSKTASGYPILCNDPHLQLSLPSIWFEIQIHTPEFNTYGVSLPGLPGVVIGFNEDIAWGMTNVGQDILDWYRIQWADEKKEHYMLDGEKVPVEKRIEEIKIKGKKDPVLDTVKYTIWGPVVYETGDSPLKDMAMRWMAHDKPKEGDKYSVGVSVGLAKAKNYDDYAAVALSYEIPPQNIVFASKSGDIALKVNGRFPVKKVNQGRFVQDGSQSANAWQGLIPMEHVPSVKNPERGFVASANQRSTDDTYPYPYFGGFDDYRGRYINQRLTAMENITPKDMMNLQNDNYSLKAEEGLPALLGLIDESQLDEEARNYLMILKEWDYHFDEKLKAPIIFEEWIDKAYDDTFDEVLAFKDSMEILYPETWRFIEMLRQTPQHPFFDNKTTTTLETAQNIVTESFRVTCEEWKEKLEDENYDWSTYKSTRISHLGRIPAFTVKDVASGGFRHAPNAISSSHGPSWRMIVAFQEGELEAYGVYPGGQSGNPGSRYYDDMIQQWAKGTYNELFFMKDAQDERQEKQFTLQFKNK